MINDSTSTLWYDRPADRWTDALPLGNGRIGAMCFGGTDTERFQLNHTTGWSGGPATERSGRLPSARACRAAVEASRAAVASGDWPGADRAVRTLQHGYPQSFLPVAELIMTIAARGQDAVAPVADYRRRLDLATAVHSTRYRRGSTVITSRTRASHPADVLLITVDADGAGVDLTLGVQSPLRSSPVGDGPDLLLRFPSNVAPAYDKQSEPLSYADGDQLALDGAVAVRWSHDGSAVADTAHALRAEGVHHAEILLAIETNYTRIGDPLDGDATDALHRATGRILAAQQAGAAAVAAAQEHDHRQLFERCVIKLGDAGAERPLDQRLAAAYARGRTALDSDPGLAALLFGYGRYLLICSSRPGGLPANLQGIWNDSMRPPWSSDFTMNINLEMNYWLAESTDLVECLDPLFDLVEALAAKGTQTAQRVLGAPGWVAFHNSDAWAYTQPVGDGTHDPCWAFWPMAGPWLLQHWRERLGHGGSDQVADRAWPLVRGAVEFLLSWLVEQPDGSLGSCPSTSPENHFTAPDGSSGATAASATLDIALSGDTFSFLVELADRLGRADDPIVAQARQALTRLPDPKINKLGMISEWPDPDLVPEPDHRHTAHLYLLHPGNRPLTPELITAADASLTGRGDESTGWSLVWKAAMRARLRQPDRVADLFRLLFRDAAIDRGHWAGGLYQNLFAAHPPFQIDANFGFVAALAECLLQSHAGAIDLLPALPTVIGAGSIRGLIARPGVVVDLDWSATGLTRARLTSRTSITGQKINYGAATVTRTLPRGVPV
ncbi:MAG TPA: glycoside hydrolase family 95 protein, partial [Microlunatus sp.]